MPLVLIGQIVELIPNAPAIREVLVFITITL
jgi:hypothetical protein